MASARPTMLMKNNNEPPTESIMPFKDPGLSSATVVSTFGHTPPPRTGAFIDGKLKGPRKLFLNTDHPENTTTNSAVEIK